MGTLVKMTVLAALVATMRPAAAYAQRKSDPMATFTIAAKHQTAPKKDWAPEFLELVMRDGG